MDNTDVASDLSVLPYLRFSIILTLHGKVVRTLHTRKKRRLYSLLDRREWDSAYLKVRYGTAGGNEGIYTNTASFVEALLAFTEMELVQYVMGEKT